MNQIETITNIKDNVESLSTTVLSIDAWILSYDMTWKVYDKRDLANAVLIMNHIAMNLWYHNFKDKWLTQDETMLMTWEYWKNIKQSLKLFTWVDLHTVFHKK